MQVNQTYEKNYTVKETHTAQAISSGLQPVLSTPHMISYMKNTSNLMLQEELDENQQSVGVEVNIRHMAPTLVGEEVTVTATFLESNGKIYTFEVEATADGKTIGKGTHKRAVINPEEFMAKAGK